MPTPLPDGDPPRPDGTPPDVDIRWEARKPVTDPALGIPVGKTANPAENRLVAIGDSITHGFQSLAISKTNLSWPAIVAHQLGLTGELGGPPSADFRFPTYDGYGGLPFNLEWCVRGLQERFGSLALPDAPAAVMSLIHLAYDIKHWWTRDADRAWDPGPGLNHNLAVYSYDVQAACTRQLQDIEHAIAHPALLHWLSPMTANDVDRAAHRVLANADSYMTLLGAAEAHGNRGGIDTLVVALGANNVLDVVVGLNYKWSTSEADRAHGHAWSPEFFASDWAKLITGIRPIKANRVVIATVPHVTVVPLFAGAGARLRPDSRYFEYYTHYWLRDGFDPNRDPHLTGAQARAIDSAIDQYNETIIESVRAARTEGLDWYVLEMSGLLDRLAWRRYLTNPATLPSWWEEVGGAYPLPAPIAALGPTPDTQFFTASQTGRVAGGLIALDGIHPTTIGYGILAQEVINVLKTAGVSFPGTTDIDFDALLAQDTLVSDPPATLAGDLHIVGWLNKHIDMITALSRA